MMCLRELLPSLLTMASLLCGFLSIFHAIRPDGSGFVSAGWLILAAAVFDALDGMTARLVKSQSKFGVQLDSLADICSFGMAPAVLLYQYHLQSLPGVLGKTLAFLFFACGAMRLARFNSQLTGFDKSIFKGLPIPSAAAVMASLVVFNAKAFGGMEWSEILIAPLTVITALLMVSPARYETLGRMAWDPSRSKARPVIALLLLIVLVIRPAEAFFLMGIVYVSMGLPWTLAQLMRGNDTEVEGAVSIDKNRGQ